MPSSKLEAISPSSSLPPEIIEAIFYLLPAKSLGRFKSVSKTWNSLISDHLQNTAKLILVSNTNSLLYSLDTNQLLPYLLNSRNNDDIHATVKELSFRCNKVLGSCNGLVLAKDENDSMFLINPTTQERCEVPVSPFVPPGGDFAVKYYGFGYDSSTDDYKIGIISIWYHEGEYGNYDPVDTYLTVYSLRNNSWTKLPDSSHFVGLYVGLPVVVNQQSFNWLQDFSTIVSFSFTTQEFNLFKFPDRHLYGGGCVLMKNMVDIGGKLGASISKGNVYELWVMEDNIGNSSWTRVCFREFKDCVKPVCLVEGSKRDIIFDVKGGDIRVFNIDEERCRNVRIEGDFGGFDVLGAYAESLESPKRILREEHPTSLQ